MSKVSLKKYLRDITIERDRRYEQRFAAQEEALRRSDKYLDEYKAQANEWRGQSKDRENNFVNKNTFDEWTKSVQNSINMLNTIGGENKGRKDAQGTSTSLIISLVAVLTAIGVLVLNLFKTNG